MKSKIKYGLRIEHNEFAQELTDHLTPAKQWNPVQSMTGRWEEGVGYRQNVAIIYHTRNKKRK